MKHTFILYFKALKYIALWNRCTYVHKDLYTYIWKGFKKNINKIIKKMQKYVIELDKKKIMKMFFVLLLRSNMTYMDIHIYFMSFHDIHWSILCFTPLYSPELKLKVMLLTVKCYAYTGLPPEILALWQQAAVLRPIPPSRQRGEVPVAEEIPEREQERPEPEQREEERELSSKEVSIHSMCPTFWDLTRPIQTWVILYIKINKPKMFTWSPPESLL